MLCHMHLPAGWLLPPCWKAGPLPEASAKAPRQTAEDTTSLRCNVVNEVAELTQNHLQQLQLKSEVSQETVMWKTTSVFCRPLPGEDFCQNFTFLTLPLLSCFSSKEQGPFYQWAKLLCSKNLTSFSLFKYLSKHTYPWCSCWLFPSSAWS